LPGVVPAAVGNSWLFYFYSQVITSPPFMMAGLDTARNTIAKGTCGFKWLPRTRLHLRSRSPHGGGLVVCIVSGTHLQSCSDQSQHLAAASRGTNNPAIGSTLLIFEPDDRHIDIPHLQLRTSWPLFVVIYGIIIRPHICAQRNGFMVSQVKCP
jgi:hypothetical protein